MNSPSRAAGIRMSEAITPFMCVDKCCSNHNTSKKTNRCGLNSQSNKRTKTFFSPAFSTHTSGCFSFCFPHVSTRGAGRARTFSGVLQIRDCVTSTYPPIPNIHPARPQRSPPPAQNATASSTPDIHTHLYMRWSFWPFWSLSPLVLLILLPSSRSLCRRTRVVLRRGRLFSLPPASSTAPCHRTPPW